MKFRNSVFATVLVLFSAPLHCVAQESNADYTDSHKAVGGFSAMLMITSDKDWQEKWYTPESTVPKFTTTDSVSVGQTIVILPFFANPALGKDGIPKIRCDIRMTKPDGSVGTNQKDVLCFPPVKLPKPQNVQITNMAIMFQAEDSDPKGRWSVEVTIHDLIGHRELPLKKTFTVK